MTLQGENIHKRDTQTDEFSLILLMIQERKDNISDVVFCNDAHVLQFLPLKGISPRGCTYTKWVRDDLVVQFPGDLLLHRLVMGSLLGGP